MNQTHDPDANARAALRMIGPDPANWVPDRPGIDHNVAIIEAAGSNYSVPQKATC